MVVRRRIASAYEDGAKRRVKQYGTMVGIFVILMYFISSGSKEEDAINDIRPLKSKSKINSFSGPYEIRAPQQEAPEQIYNHPPVPPQSTADEINESIKGAQLDIEKVGHRESMKAQEELLEKTLEAASDSLRKHPIENKDIDPKSIEDAVALRLEEEVSSKLAEVTDNLIDEKESSLIEMVDQDQAEGLDSKQIIEDVASMEKISIKELKQEISDEVHSIEKILHKEASIIEDQILKETLDNIEKENEDEHDVADGDETKGNDEDETEQENNTKENIDETEYVAKTIKNEEQPSKIISLVDETEEDNVEEISNDKVEENNEEISVEEKEPGKIISLVDETEDNAAENNEEINTEEKKYIRKEKDKNKEE